MKRYLIGLFTLLLLCGSSLYAANNGPIKLNSAFHHRINNGQKNTAEDIINNSFELGSITLYFDQKPLFNAIPQRNAGAKYKQAYFLFPQVAIGNNKCKQMIQHINDQSGLFYTVSLQEVKKPTQGLMLTINYEPEKVHFVFGQLHSMQRKKGVLFKFYNVALLKKVNKLSPTLLRTAYAKKKRAVVIDCGHGGVDCGASGCHQVQEKQLTLSIGKRVAHLLNKSGVSVYLTRHEDKTVGLDERTTRANSADAALFVSIHANAAVRQAASGIETFCLYRLPPEIAAALALAKNTAPSKRQQIFDIAAKKVLSNRHDEGFRLAQTLQNGIIETIRAKQQIIDRGVKHEWLQVLLGVHMPAALVEVGFITNPHEARSLANAQYQELIAQGICNGILSYLKNA